MSLFSWACAKQRACRASLTYKQDCSSLKPQTRHSSKSAYLTPETLNLKLKPSKHPEDSPEALNPEPP